MISTGDHMLFDYNFQFAVEIEALLIRENAILLDSQTPLKYNPLRFSALKTRNMKP